MTNYPVTLSATCRATVAGPSQPSYASRVLNDGATSYYRLNEGPLSGGYMYDSSPNGKVGVAYNTGSEQGPLSDGNLAYIMGNPDYANVSDWPGLDPTGSFSVEAWVNPSSSYGGYGGIVSKNNYSGTAVGYMLGAGAGVYYFVLNGSAGEVASSVAPITGAWQHLVGTFNLSTATMCIYMNGVLTGTTAYAGPIGNAAANNFYIGADGAFGYWTGGISDVALYNGVALTSTQVANHYAAAKNQMTKSVNRNFYGSASSSLVIVKSAKKALLVPVSTSGAVANKAISRKLTGASSSSAHFIKSVSKLSSAPVSTTAATTLLKQLGRKLTSAVSTASAAILSKKLAKNLTAGSTTSALALKLAQHSLQTSSATSTSVTGGSYKAKNFSTSSATTTHLGKNAAKSIVASVVASATVAHPTVKLITGYASTACVLSRVLSCHLRATSVAGASLQRPATKTASTSVTTHASASAGYVASCVTYVTSSATLGRDFPVSLIAESAISITTSAVRMRRLSLSAFVAGTTNLIGELIIGGVVVTYQVYTTGPNNEWTISFAGAPNVLEQQAFAIVAAAKASDEVDGFWMDFEVCDNAIKQAVTQVISEVGPYPWGSYPSSEQPAPYNDDVALYPSPALYPATPKPIIVRKK